MRKGITLIALVITIIILLILAGVTIQMVLNGGIIDKAVEGSDQYNKAQIKQEIEFAIVDIQAEQLQSQKEFNKDILIEKLPEKLPDIMAEIAGDQIIGEYQGYDYTIDENNKITIGEKLKGNKPTVEIELLTTQISLKVQIRVRASVEGGEIQDITPPPNATLVQQISEAEKIYEVSNNQKYTFIATTKENRKGSGFIEITNAIEKPVLEVVQKNIGTVTLKVKNPTKNANYSYYVDNVAKVTNSAQTQITIDNLMEYASYSFHTILSVSGQTLQSDPLTVPMILKLRAPCINIIPEGTIITPLTYPVITPNGIGNCTINTPLTVGQKVTVRITNNNTEGDIYYSLDKGNTWKLYTNEFTTTYEEEGKIQAKVQTKNQERVSPIRIQKNSIYILDLSKDCTAADALDKKAYDNDPSTYMDITTNKCRFYFGADRAISTGTDVYQIAFGIDPKYSGHVFDKIGGGGYCASHEGKFYQGLFHATYWGSSIWEQQLYQVSTNVNEIYYDGNIP